MYISEKMLLDHLIGISSIGRWRSLIKLGGLNSGMEIIWHYEDDEEDATFDRSKAVRIQYDTGMSIIGICTDSELSIDPEISEHPSLSEMDRLREVWEENHYEPPCGLDFSNLFFRDDISKLPMCQCCRLRKKCDSSRACTAQTAGKWMVVEELCPGELSEEYQAPGCCTQSKYTLHFQTGDFVIEQGSSSSAYVYRAEFNGKTSEWGSMYRPMNTDFDLQDADLISAVADLTGVLVPVKKSELRAANTARCKITFE